MAYVPTSIDSIVRRINLSEGHYLFPLYEAVVNSIQAISEAKVIGGEIQIYIEREEAKQINTDASVEKYAPIKSFRIIDNGIGFNDVNYKSFDEYYTPHKLAIGCKGVGRFMALAAFAKVNIESIYYNALEKGFYLRVIEFDIKDGIKQIKNEKVKQTKPQTTVLFYNYYDKFAKSTSTITVAEKLLQHCLIYFITNSNPIIKIYDNGGAEVIDLQLLFNEMFTPEDEIGNFEINGEAFELNYLKNYLKKGQHKLHYCANDREVDDLNINELIPNFTKPLEDEKGKYTLAVYLKSELLNKNLNDFRNEFSIPKSKKDRKNMFAVVSMEEINENVALKIKEKYNDYISEFSIEKNEDLRQYIFANGRYEYMHLLEYNELLETIPPGLPDKDKDYHLHRINYELEVKHKANVNEFLVKSNGNTQNQEEYKKLFEELINYENASGKSKLANYMLHRKAVLKILEKFIWVKKDGNYMLEEDIHQIIFQKGKTNDQILFNNHNLWILDERIAYHQYIASDKGFKEMHILDSDSSKAPDLLIYDNRFAYGEAKDIVVIFEFKRPMRSYFTESEKNLGNQILTYVDILIDSKSTDHNGRPLKITKETPKFGYVICDYSHDKNHEAFLLTRGYKQSPKGSLFKYEEGLNLFIEILTYDQLLEDANLRHKAFFSELGIDGI